MRDNKFEFLFLFKDKEILKEDFDKAIGKISKWHMISQNNIPILISIKPKYYISIKGDLVLSGKYIEAYVLDLLIQLNQLGYYPTIVSHEWHYGTNADWDWYYAASTQ